MNSKSALLSLACIGLMMTGSGCYYSSPYGYGAPNNMGGYPPGGVIQSPGNFGPTVVPDGTGTFQQGQPTPAPEYDNFNSGSGNDAPFYDPNASSNNNNNNGVPYTPQENKTFESNEDTFDFDTSSPGDETDYFDNSDPLGSVEKKNDLQQVAYSTETEFKEPKLLQPIPEATSVMKQTTDDLQGVPYGYDKVQYSWLRGVADYDKENQTWHIMYNIRPENDQFGGEFALTDHAATKNLKNGDVILVKGYVDDSDRDAYGKVLYRVEELVPLKKKS